MDHAQYVCFRRLLGQLATYLVLLNPEVLADLAVVGCQYIFMVVVFIAHDNRLINRTMFC